MFHFIHSLFRQPLVKFFEKEIGLEGSIQARHLFLLLLRNGTDIKVCDILLVLATL
jgi:hypothetical protein